MSLGFRGWVLVLASAWSPSCSAAVEQRFDHALERIVFVIERVEVHPREITRPPELVVTIRMENAQDVASRLDSIEYSALLNSVMVHSGVLSSGDLVASGDDEGLVRTSVRLELTVPLLARLAAGAVEGVEAGMRLQLTGTCRFHVGTLQFEREFSTERVEIELLGIGVEFPKKGD